MRFTRILAIPALGAALIFGLACSEPGPAEKAGKAFDDTVEKLQHGDEGTLEKTGRKLDEAVEDAEKEDKKKS
jgi:hypothetical protein